MYNSYTFNGLISNSSIQMTSCLACLLRYIPVYKPQISCAVPLGYTRINAKVRSFSSFELEPPFVFKSSKDGLEVKLMIYMQTAHAFEIHGTRRLRQFITSLTVIPNYNNTILVHTSSTLFWRPVKKSRELQLHVLIVWPLYTRIDITIAGECLLIAF